MPDQELKINITADASSGMSELDRYNAKLKEMADRTEAASVADREANQEREKAARWLKAKAEATERMASASAEAKAADDELAKTVKVLGEKDVEAALASADATKKAVSAKQQWTAVVNGLRTAFPQLAAVMRLAFNPVTIALSAITTSLVVLRDKLKATSTDFQAAAWGQEKLNGAAEAYERMAKAVSQMKSESAQLNQELAKTATYFGNLRKIAGDNPMLAKREQEERGKAQSAQIASLRIQAQNLRRQAGAVDVPDHMRDQNTLSSLEPDAQRAATEIVRLDEEIKRIENAYSPENAGLGRSTPEHIALALKYGAFTKPEDMVAALKNERGGWQGMVSRRDTFQQRMAANAAARSFRGAALGKASDLESQANDLESSRRTDQFNTSVDYGMAMRERGIPFAVTPQGGGASVMSAAAAEIQRMDRQAAEMAAAFNTMAEIWGRTQRSISATAARATNKPD